MGIKGRVAFEAPAAHLLITAHRELEKLVLTGKQMFWKESLGNLYGTMLHEGHFFDPLCRDLEAFLDSSQATVTGDVRPAAAPPGLPRGGRALPVFPGAARNGQLRGEHPAVVGRRGRRLRQDFRRAPDGRPEGQGPD